MSEIQSKAETNINEANSKNSLEARPDEQTSWGPKLFYGVLIAVLVFFWWMVIYPHGVTPTH